MRTPKTDINYLDTDWHEFGTKWPPEVFHIHGSLWCPESISALASTITVRPAAETPSSVRPAAGAPSAECCAVCARSSVAHQRPINSRCRMSMLVLSILIRGQSRTLITAADRNADGWFLLQELCGSSMLMSIWCSRNVREWWIKLPFVEDSDVREWYQLRLIEPFSLELIVVTSQEIIKIVLQHVRCISALTMNPWNPYVLVWMMNIISLKDLPIKPPCSLIRDGLSGALPELCKQMRLGYKDIHCPMTFLNTAMPNTCKPFRTDVYSFQFRTAKNML